jgi:hypothetical protein
MTVKLKRMASTMMEKSGIDMSLVKFVLTKKRHERDSGHLNHVTRYIKTLPIFSELFEEEEAFDSLSSSFMEKPYKNGTYICTEDKEGSEYYIIL